MLRISIIILRMWLWYICLFPCLLLNKKLFKRYYRFVSRRFYRLLNIKINILNKEPHHQQPLLFIGNHDSIFEPLILQADLNLRTIARGGNNYIFFALNFIMRQFGNIITFGNSRQETKEVYQQALKVLQQDKRFFIFPSAGINKTLCQQFSSSIYKIAKAKNALVVPIFFHYKNCDIRHLSQKYKNIALVKQFIKVGLQIDVEFGQALDPKQFHNNGDFVKQAQMVYAKALYTYAPTAT